MLPRRRREGAHRRFGSAACMDIPAIRGVGKETGRGSSNAQEQEECLPGVWPDLRAERRGRGLVPAALLHAGLRRRREGKAPGEPDPVKDDTVREPRVLEALAQVLGEASPQEIAAAENEEAEEAQEPGVMAIEVTADRALIARTRPGEEGRAEVEWGGSFDHRRGGRDGEIVKLLEPGCERRVRAREQTIERDEGEVDGLKLWMERGSGLNPSRTTGRRPRHSGR